MLKIFELSFLLLCLVLVKTRVEASTSSIYDEYIAVFEKPAYILSLNSQLNSVKINLKDIEAKLLVLTEEINGSENSKLSFEQNQEFNKLIENIFSLETLLRDMRILTSGNENENENERSLKYYDENFNCLRNCSQPTCLSKSYRESGLSKDLPKSCAEATASNEFNNGIYLLKPNVEMKPFYVYCDHDVSDEKGWTIIQRREDGAVSFNRNWLDYKHGFGDLNGEYWIGLERLHAITTAEPHELWIFLRDYENGYSYEYYSNFSVASEKEDYTLTIAGYNGKIGDSFGPHNDLKFSTFDKDNDLTYLNCARMWKAGWWFSSCYDCNLNGVYYSMSNRNSGDGIEWIDWHGTNSSLKYVHMAIRPLEL